MKEYIIKTSNLGYDCGVYKVNTNLPIYRFKEIDNKYGMQYRHHSTSIKQLKEGAEKEGFIFNYETIIDSNGIYNPKSKKYKEDYFANFGNY